MVAQVSGLQVGEFVHTFGDVHLYSNHLEQTREQLSRTPGKLPVLRIRPGVTSIFDFAFEDFELVGYWSDNHQHQGSYLSLYRSFRFWR
jgi:thymidylate synthase